MNTLPIEIQNEIWNIYWKGEFKNCVLDRFNEVNEKILKMDIFLVKHFYLNVNINYDYEIAHYLRQYNEFLQTIHNEKGLFKYISVTNDQFTLCFNRPYLRSCFSKIADRYKHICVYCLCNGIPNMSRRIVDRFKILSEKINYIRII